MVHILTLNYLRAIFARYGSDNFIKVKKMTAKRHVYDVMIPVLRHFNEMKNKNWDASGFLHNLYS